MKTCSTCHFFRQNENYKKGICFANPPSVLQDGDGNIKSLGRPRVYPDNPACRHYREFDKDLKFSNKRAGE